MPIVTVYNEQGETQTESGGCFGFTGRYARAFPSLSGSIATYSYHLGDNISNRYISIRGTKCDPTDFIKFLAEESWISKYVDNVDWVGNGRGQSTTPAQYTNNTKINIKTDIPGHCVIGTASVFRIISKQAQMLIPFWNACNTLGVNGDLALLVYYAIQRCVTPDLQWISNNVPPLPTNIGDLTLRAPEESTGRLGFGDDEFLALERITSGHLYSMIRGDAEWVRNDQSEIHYSESRRYEQNILMSSRPVGSRNDTPAINFGNWLLQRFKTTLNASDSTVVSGSSMGGNPVTSIKAPICLRQAVGWAAALDTEFRNFGRFGGLF